MTPLHLEILIHYFSLGGNATTKARQYRGGDFSAPAVREYIDELLGYDLLSPMSNVEGRLSLSNTMILGECGYGITERGIAHIKSLCRVRPPVIRFVTEWPKEAA